MILQSNTSFYIVRHEGAGVELALKAKEFGPNGSDYAAGTVTITDGIAHYNVSSGASPDNAARADWSFDYAATVLPQGVDDSFDFKLFIDIDETQGSNLVEVPLTTFAGREQGSSNYGFAAIRSLIDVDDAADGVQPYNYGAGEFDIVLEAYDDGALIATNKIVVHVDGFGFV